MQSSFFRDFLIELADRGRIMLGQPATTNSGDVVTLSEQLLSGKGEASGVARAQMVLAAYGNGTTEQRLKFLKALQSQFGADPAEVLVTMEECRSQCDELSIQRLYKACEPRRQELIRRLNLAPGGTAALVRMREDLLACLGENPELKPVDDDFLQLFSNWFNRGFLFLQSIDWSTPANILEKIVRYEAVHAISDWQDLRGRLEPPDRRCFAFFHPQLVDEPLIFVEVALTVGTPTSIGPLLDPAREPIAAIDATTAVFYSISNTQKGLGKVSFGNFLIKQVVSLLQEEMPNIKDFVTLSPVPGFARWLATQRQGDGASILDDALLQDLSVLDDEGWQDNDVATEGLRPALLSAAASYFLAAKSSKGGPVDPVARFHLGNGARLEQINFLADLSENGLHRSHGVMVNYRYDIGRIEKNHEAFARNGEVIASPQVVKLSRNELRPLPRRRAIALGGAQQADRQAG